MQLEVNSRPLMRLDKELYIIDLIDSYTSEVKCALKSNNLFL